MTIKELCFGVIIFSSGPNAVILNNGLYCDVQGDICVALLEWMVSSKGPSS